MKADTFQGLMTRSRVASATTLLSQYAAYCHVSVTGFLLLNIRAVMIIIMFLLTMINLHQK